MSVGRDRSLKRDTARAIVVHNDSILLLERWRGDEHYFSIPGGGIEPYEDAEQAVLRELAEETSIKVGVSRLLYKWVDGPHTHLIYLCTYISGEPVLPGDSEEAAEGENNRFEPKWVPLGDLPKLRFVYWKPVFEQLQKDLRSSFSDLPKILGS